MRERGLSPAQAAFLLGFALFSTAITRPVFGFLADKFQKHKMVLIVCMLVSSIFYGSLWLIPSLGTKDGMVAVYIEDSNIVCYEGNVFAQLYEARFGDLRHGQNKSGNISFNCKMECERSDFAYDTYLQLSQDMSISCPLTNISPGANISAASLEMKVEFLTQTIGRSKRTVTTCKQIKTSDMHTNNGTAQDTVCNQTLPFKCKANCLLASEYTNSSYHHVGIKNPLLYVFIIIFLLANSFQSTTVNLVDAVTYNILGSKRTNWGLQRLWGTIGWALSGVSAGYIMDVATSEGKVDRYLCCFVLYIGFCCAGAFSVSFYKTAGDIKCSHPAQKLWQFLRNFELMSLFVLVFVLGAFIGVAQNFLLWHLQNLGASQLLLGLSIAAGCIPEIPLLFAMGHIITFAGERVCLYISCVAYGCRFLGYSLLTNPWFALLVEPLHCMSYTLAYGAASVYGSRLTPDGMHGTMQAILSTLVLGFGEAHRIYVIGHVTQVAIPRSSILVPFLYMKSPRLIWRSNTYKFHLCIPDLQINFGVLTAWQASDPNNGY